MKHKLYIAAAALTGLLTLAACDDDWQQIPLDQLIPQAPEGMEPTLSIAEFKDLYWSTNTNSASVVGLLENGKDAIIAGRIVSSDRSGNIYKNLIIEDEEGYALTIGVSSSDLYKTYQMGQRIVINCTGLYAGMYNNLFQLGGLGEYNGNPSMTFANADDFKAHAWLDGLANVAKVDTFEVTIDELANADRKLWQSRLVRIDNVSWVGAGTLTFADGASTGSSATNRYVKDSNGRQLLVRNSSHADFQATTLPVGRGSVTGILSYYGSDWQLLLNGTDGLQGFEWIDANASTGIFKRVSALEAGARYAIVANGEAATPISGTYGYLRTAPVTINNDQFEGSLLNSFIFTALDGGYTIQDMTEQYYYMSGTYNSFNVSSTLAPGDTSYIWDITFEADGTAKITNRGKGKYLQFYAGASYNSFGAYDYANGPLPTLYKFESK